jgi:hypothetical protein
VSFIEASGIEIALKGPEFESGWTQSHRVLEQCPSYSPSRRIRVDIELIDPLLVERHQGYRFAAAVGDPNLARQEHDLLEPTEHFLIGVDS